MTVHRDSGWFGGARWRYFGPAPLIEDNGAVGESQLPGETEPVEDIHFHPVAPRTLRITATTRFYGDAAHFPAESSR